MINHVHKTTQKTAHNTCDNPLLLRASRMLKTNPEIWYKWMEYEVLKPHKEGLEKWIFTDL